VRSEKKNRETAYIVEVRMIRDAAVADEDWCDGDDDKVDQICVGSEERRNDACTALDHERLDAEIAEGSEDGREMQQMVSDRDNEYFSAGGLKGSAAGEVARIVEIGISSKEVRTPA